MPAARGGSRIPAKPRVKTPAKAPRAASAKARTSAGPKVSAAGVVLIALGVLALTVAIALGTGGRGQRLVQTAQAKVDGRFAQAGFRLKTIHVEGASRLAEPDILRAAQSHMGEAMLGLDLDAVRQDVRRVGWVKDTRIVRLLPDTLVIAVEERRQQAVWQHAGRSVVIDDHGVIIPEADPADFASLPLVVGAGGAAHAAEVLPLLAQRPRLIGRLEALVRVDDRRWDLRLKDGSLIQLPAAEEEHALAQLETLDHRSRILDLGFERIDLRNPEVVAVRPRAIATTTPGGPAAEGA
jgi:cell division protein FtsQ